MIPLLFALSAYGEEPRWVGLPAESLPAIGLGTPTVSEDVAGLSRYPLAAGGVVSVYVMPTVAEADQVFDRLEQTGATRWPPVEKSPGDRAIGDGAGLALVRDRNVVIYVRDLGGTAGSVVGKVLAALAADPG